ncbi:MAG: aspartate-semialdehyde dehydrogenase [Clostridia bacterium]|nr:aspartate-semialdehyde dehydrogenase [Clostridia bacterium]
MSKNYKLAIVGATGLVGRTALKVLEEKKLPNFEYKMFCSKKSAGEKIKFLGTEYIAQELTETSFDEGFDFAIFSAGGDTSKKFAPIAVEKGCIVIDNSSAYRMDENVPLVVPEVNPDDIFLNKGIIANPNCSTIQAVVALKPLDDKYKIKRVIYSTYQAVSGAGIYGLEDLKTQASGDKLKKFSHQIYNNCLPHIDVFTEDGYTKEEHKMINETRKILGNPDLAVTATTVRVPVENCHSESINIEFENDFDIADVINTLKTAPGILVQDDPSNEIYPIATEANGHDEVFVGRIRRDFSQPKTLNIWVVADNIRKGAASNAIQIMERLIEK